MEGEGGTEEVEGGAEEEEVKEEQRTVTGLALPRSTVLCHSSDSVPRNSYSSVSVMKVLLSPCLDRCHSLPEVKTTYVQSSQFICIVLLSIPTV